MDEGYAALTEKEKETLRLMVRGHDAKSMANELSLSVHTINDRLKVARRKLAVTSSREAARLVLEQEAGTPEKLGTKEIGDANTTTAPDTHSTAMGNRPIRLVAGVLLMMTLMAAGLVFLSQANSTLDETPASQIAAQDAKVEAAAHAWMAFHDAGDWQAAYDSAGASFREANTLSAWSSAATQMRTPLGDHISREMLTVRYLNAPPSGYQEVTFASRYEGRNTPVTETLTLEKEGESWRVVGILID